MALADIDKCVEAAFEASESVFFNTSASAFVSFTVSTGEYSTTSSDALLESTRLVLDELDVDCSVRASALNSVPSTVS
jgi:hypothetical protein